VRKSYKYRLYPNRAQAEALTEQLETHRRIYNSALEERMTAWKEGQRCVRYGDQSRAHKEARRENEFYARLNFSSAQATLRKLNLAYEAFFRRVKAGQAPGYPRFKGRSRFRSICYPSHGDGCKVRQDSEGRTRLYVQNVGEVKVKLHRPWKGDIKTVTVRREVDRWCVVLSCDLGPSRLSRVGTPRWGLTLGSSRSTLPLTGRRWTLRNTIARPKNGSDAYNALPPVGRRVRIVGARRVET